jgi:hypothetical protein
MMTVLRQLPNLRKREQQIKEHKIEVLKNPKIEKTLEELRIEALDLINQTRSREMKPSALLEVIQNYVPNRKLRVRLGKLIRAYESKEIRMPKLLSEMQVTVADVSFDERKPAPKFLGIEFYDLVDVRESGTDHVSLVVRGERERIVTTKSDFLARYVLSQAPELMPLLMKVSAGQEYSITDLQEVDFVIKDKFVEYTEKNFSRINNNPYLLDICEEYLAHVQSPNPMNYVWGTTLKKGDRVRVQWLDYHTYHQGVVSNANDGPVRIRYESGEVINLFKHQPVKVIK